MEVSQERKVTCPQCYVIFTDLTTWYAHLKSDWHRYNLKRNAAELPPISAQDFQVRVLQQRKHEELSKQSTQVYCQACRKQFSNENSYKNHLPSKRHIDNEKHQQDVKVVSAELEEPVAAEVEEPSDDSDVEEVDSDEWDEESTNPIDENKCIFCPHKSHNFLKNLDHMTNVHSFFIPDIEFCIDIKGLMHYLGEKVHEGFMCLWCNEKGRTFYSAEAVQNHMFDKGHTKMIFEGPALAEYTDFYDYSSTHPDVNEENIDEEVTIPELDDSDSQMVLPSGAVIGHRSLMRYYKQRFNPNSTALVAAKSSKKLHKVLATYRALGWTDTQQEAAARRAKDIHYMKRMQAKLRVKLGTKANKLQKHFRQQTNY